MSTLYTTRATAIGGRSGHSQLDDGSFGVDLVPPNSKRDGRNPEQLFAVGYAACFDNAIIYVLKQQNLPDVPHKTSVQVSLLQEDSSGLSLDIDLTVKFEGITQEQADSVIHAAHEICPYSKAIRNNVVVRLQANVAQETQ